MKTTSRDAEYMMLALVEAEKAGSAGDVPVGAVVVSNGKVLAAAHNRRVQDNDPMAHAEVLALTAAAKRLGSWRLDECTMYVTLEPCAMCAGALVAARLSTVVFGAREPREGAVRSVYQLVDDSRRTHQLDVREGVLADRSAALLRSFFLSYRG